MKNKLIWITLSFLIITAMLLVSCGPAEVAEEEEEEEEMVEEEEEEEEVVEVEVPTYGGTFNVSISSMGDRFDPYGPTAGINGYGYESLLYGDYYTPLEDWTFEGEFCPIEYTTGWLAESWEFNDPYTYTFKLREGVYWWDKAPANGREMTAEDVKSHYETFLASQYTSKADLVNIKSITVPDKYTIVFHLDQPRTSEAFMMFRGHPGSQGVVACPDVIEAYGPDAFVDWRNALGTGPWILVDYVSGSSATFHKNPKYWDFDQNYPNNRLPYMDGVVQLEIGDKSTEIAALRTGKLDYLRGVTWEQVDSLAATNPELNKRKLLATPDRLHMHCKKEPFTDVRVRQAMQMAINQEEMIEGYFRGNAELGHSTWPFAKYWGDYSIPVEELPESVQEIYGYNPERAMELLDQAGYTADPVTGIRIETEVACEQINVDWLSIVKAYLREIGVDMKINVMERGAYSAVKYPHTYPQMITHYMAAPTCVQGGPLHVFDVYFLQGFVLSLHEWEDPVWQQTYQEAKMTQDDAERWDMTKQLCIDLLEAVPIILVPAQYYYIYWQPWVNGCYGRWGMLMNNYNDFKHYWLDRDLKESMTGER